MSENKEKEAGNGPFFKKMLDVNLDKIIEGAGDGLFARIDIPAHTTCAFYNGVRVKPGEAEVAVLMT